MPRYRFIAVGTPYPFPTETAAAFAEGLTDVIVFEELDSVLEEEMLKLAGARHLPLRVHGKLTGEANDRGENTAENIAGRLGRFFDRTHRSNGLARPWWRPPSAPTISATRARYPCGRRCCARAALTAAASMP